jgi:hypothetical protein
MMLSVYETNAALMRTIAQGRPAVNTTFERGWRDDREFEFELECGLQY